LAWQEQRIRRASWSRARTGRAGRASCPLRSCLGAPQGSGAALALRAGAARAQVTTDMSDFDAGLIFEQDPVQIIDALLPLYLNCTLLRSLQARSWGACEACGSWLWP